MNSASTFGVEGTRWLQSAKATAQTLLNTFGGAGVGLVLCYFYYYYYIYYRCGPGAMLLLLRTHHPRGKDGQLHHGLSRIQHRHHLPVYCY